MPAELREQPGGPDRYAQAASHRRSGALAPPQPAQQRPRYFGGVFLEPRPSSPVSYKMEERSDERLWLPTQTRMPKDGDKAEVRPNSGRHPLILVFRAKPVARWESLDGRGVYDFEYFEHWRRV